MNLVIEFGWLFLGSTEVENEDILSKSRRFVSSLFTGPINEVSDPAQLSSIPFSNLQLLKLVRLLLIGSPLIMVAQLVSIYQRFIEISLLTVLPQFYLTLILFRIFFTLLSVPMCFMSLIYLNRENYRAPGYTCLITAGILLGLDMLGLGLSIFVAGILTLIVDKDYSLLHEKYKIQGLKQM